MLGKRVKFIILHKIVRPRNLEYVFLLAVFFMFASGAVASYLDETSDTGGDPDGGTVLNQPSGGQVSGDKDVFFEDSTPENPGKTDAVNPSVAQSSTQATSQPTSTTADGFSNTNSVVSPPPSYDNGGTVSNPTGGGSSGNSDPCDKDGGWGPGGKPDECKPNNNTQGPTNQPQPVSGSQQSTTSPNTSNCPPSKQQQGKC